MNFWLLLSTVAFIFSLAVTVWVHNQYHLAKRVLPTPAPVGPAPLISVIVPVRNEERNIAACLQALLDQTYPSYEVIVVNDRSTDATPRILMEVARQNAARQEAPLQILNGSPLPPGWAGKPHALAQGARAARGAWLCFLDADTFARPELLASTLTAAQKDGADLFTIFTDQRLESFWEKVILPLVFTALSVGFSPQRVNDPDLPDAIANGQFLLFRRSAYEAIGGHASVAGSIVEDRDLARQVKTAGLRLVVADGRAVAATRMYTSFAEIWEGWTKNIYLGLRDQPGLALLGIFGAFLSLLGGLGFPAWIAASLFWLANSGGALAALALIEACLAYAILLAARGQAVQAFRIPAVYGLTLPLGAIIFAAMMITSTYNVVSGQGVTWKGRRYLARMKDREDP